jgi:hypothetical protein
MGLGFGYPSQWRQKGLCGTVTESQPYCTHSGARAWSENGTKHSLGDVSTSDLELVLVRYTVLCVYRTKHEISREFIDNS